MVPPIHPDCSPIIHLCSPPVGQHSLCPDQEGVDNRTLQGRGRRSPSFLVYHTMVRFKGIFLVSGLESVTLPSIAKLLF